MKKFSVLFVIISLFTGFTTAQIKMESVELDTPQIWTLPNSPNAFNTFEKHDLAGVKGVTIIHLNKAGERIFLLNQGLVNKPLKILMYN